MSNDTKQLKIVLEKASHFFDQFELANPSDTGKKNLTDVFTLKWDKSSGFIPVQWECKLAITDLLHVDRQAKLLLTNTQQFVANLPANNALLWGSRGTGKSSLIQAVLGSFSIRQFQVIEISNDDFSDWSEIVGWINQNSPNKFILFCDDLSFDKNDFSYKSFKAALDGSFMSLPDNALIYATSNRRHLLPEKLSDNLDAVHSEGEIHHSEAIEEAISLSDRFGLWLSFHALTQDQYLAVVKHWLNFYKINEEANEYQEVALRWALQRGSRSARIANQFARDYAGKKLLEESNSKNTL